MRTLNDPPLIRVGPETSVIYHPVFKGKGGIYLITWIFFTCTLDLKYSSFFFQLKMNCSICTELTVEICHGLFNDKQVRLISVDQLDAMGVKLIAYRTGLDEDKI